MTASALYEGSVFHERRAPREHSFRFRLFLVYVDLDELPGLFRGRWLWSAQRPNLVWFKREDYLGPHDRPLREAVLDHVERELGRRPAGPVRVLTHLRTFGYVFNPVTFYFCYGADGELDAFVAEITNTPWRERHAYVLDAHAGKIEARDRTQHTFEMCWRFPKAFHVSPFLGMQQDYEWRLRIGEEHIEVEMSNVDSGFGVFRAGLSCARRPITGPNLARALIVHPLLTLRIHAAIYWQAALLWAKRTPFFAHPRTRQSAQDALVSR